MDEFWSLTRQTITNNNQRELPLQLDSVGRLKKLMFDWTKENEIRLHTIDCVDPFVLRLRGIHHRVQYLQCLFR